MALLQAAPPSLRRVKIHVRPAKTQQLSADQLRVFPGMERSALELSWEAGVANRLMTSEQYCNSPAELCAGVRGFAAARGVLVEEDGRWAVFART